MKEGISRRAVLLLLFVTLAQVRSGAGDSMNPAFWLKSVATGSSYGPFRLEEREPILIGKSAFVVGKVDDGKFQLTSGQTGNVYGPYDLKDGLRILVGKSEFVIETQARGKPAAEPPAEAASIVMGASETTASLAGEQGFDSARTNLASASNLKNSPGHVSRPHLKLGGKKEAAELLMLFAARNASSQGARISARLLQEKSAELARTDKALETDYGVKQDDRYLYDVSSQTIFRLSGSNGKEDASEGDDLEVASAGSARRKDPVKRDVHLRMTDRKKAEEFVRLGLAKRQLSEEVRFLDALVREKRAELSRREDLLRKQYSISADRVYRYDPASMMLFELVPIPRKIAQDAEPETPRR